MSFRRSIRIYGNSVNNYDTSPFEAVDMLHRRSKIHRRWQELSTSEKAAVRRFDRVLLRNAEKKYHHINEVYDFTMSTEPDEEWWWHLDKVIAGKLTPHVARSYTTKSEVFKRKIIH
ncbi:hypothetical protein [Aneurinibacillus terranovensis]|uniref:hypothetical protein n=1 Tax=Aneurinibacillus terranovensis TaxID=278991 RepID=UPI000557C709|nr:hypothetical protein [Aneurinibacillus terranovensis]